MTKIQSNAHFKYEFFDNYVIVEGFKDANVDYEAAQATLKAIVDHYKGKDFTLISHRVNDYVVNIESYSSKIMKKVRSFAVVSENPEVKRRAIEEQDKYHNSFAFFTSLEQAKELGRKLLNYFSLVFLLFTKDLIEKSFFLLFILLFNL